MSQLTVHRLTGRGRFDRDVVLQADAVDHESALAAAREVAERDDTVTVVDPLPSGGQVTTTYELRFAATGHGRLGTTGFIKLREVIVPGGAS